MKTVITNCDICGVTIPTNKGWEYAPYELTIFTQCSSKNPMSALGGGAQRNEFLANDVCPLCHRTVAQACASVIMGLKDSRTTTIPK